jgi:pimeloyl-ACP methyl ester carboxylesterase
MKRFQFCTVVSVVFLTLVSILPLSGEVPGTIGFIRHAAAADLACPQTFPSVNGAFFECTECADSFQPEWNIQCGFLTVPQNRGVANGSTIRLYVTIFKGVGGASGQPDTGPVFFLNGGPGTSNQNAVLVFGNPQSPYRQLYGEERDIVLLDQRGSNRSEPSLYCEELGAYQDEAYFNLGYEEGAQKRVDVMMSECYTRFQAQGIDLSAYNSIENATDVRDLRDVLYGDTRINLFGASYGTSLSMTVMRLFPEIIRSVTIDSILPPEINPWNDQPAATLYSLNRFFEVAETGPNPYPGTRRIFYKTIEELARNPVIARATSNQYQGNVTIIPELYISYVVGQLKATPYNPDLPKAIATIYRTRDYTAVANAWVGNVDFFFPAGGPGSFDTTAGMFESVTYAKDAGYTSPETISGKIEEATGNYYIQRYLIQNFINYYPSVRGLWRVNLMPEEFNTPLVSDLPTLMFVGDLDPSTPETFSEPSAAHLSNSFFLVIPGGHAVGALQCVAAMLNDFINEPFVQPEYRCDTGYVWSPRR